MPSLNSPVTARSFVTLSTVGPINPYVTKLKTFKFMGVIYSICNPKQRWGSNNRYVYHLSGISIPMDLQWTVSEWRIFLIRRLSL